MNLQEKEFTCDRCGGSGKVTKHQYHKANRETYECVCGEPMISEKHYDEIGSWRADENWEDKSQLKEREE